jgi:hypothetical protein
MKSQTRKKPGNTSFISEKRKDEWSKSIGGYFEWELPHHQEPYHNDLIKLNSGRSALEYIIRFRGYKKVYLPYYICDAILQPLNRLKLDYEFYSINADLEPPIIKLKEGDALLAVNYFGLMGIRLKALSNEYKELILDNSMAFFARPFDKIPCFYSPRKFFGVPDGGLAYLGKAHPQIILKKEVSYQKTTHLIKRLDLGAEQGYEDFKKNEAASKDRPVMQMSNLTRKILASINYQEILHTRNSNFLYLHRHLYRFNELSPLISKAEVNGPMFYPFLRNNNENLRERLISQRIYVARYWPNVPHWVKANESIELYLYHNLIPLPIDQRYNLDDMDHILQQIQDLEKIKTRGRKPQNKRS